MAPSMARHRAPAPRGDRRAVCVDSRWVAGHIEEHLATLSENSGGIGMKLFNSRTVHARLWGPGPSRGPFPRAILAALVAVAFAFPLSALPALAESTLFVGTGAGAAPGCASPGFVSVQAAVNAPVSAAPPYLCGPTPFSDRVFA